MAKKSYFEKLKDPRWQRKRLEVLEAAEWQCELCMDGTKTLHVHHKAYIKDREPWEYERGQLAALCEDCHHNMHESDLLIDAISRLPLDGPMNRFLMGTMLAGAVGMDIPFDSKADAIGWAIGKSLSREFERWFAKMRDESSPEYKLVEKLMGL